jgi:hypothetical protein
MFVCEECIENYIIEGGLLRLQNTLRSNGPCEDCRRTKLCFDLPHGMYAHKDSVFGKAMRAQGLPTVGQLKQR